MNNEITERIFVNKATEARHKKLFPDHWERYQFAVGFCKPGNCVVDVACGCGYGTNILSLKIGNKAIGLDIDEESLRWAKKYYGKNCNFMKIANGVFPLQDGIADVVVSLETLEHVAEPEKFLSEIKRIMKTGGTLIISTPLNETLNRFNPENKFHLREYNWMEFDEILSKFFISNKKFSQISNLGELNRKISKSSLSVIKNIIPHGLKKIILRYILKSKSAKSGKIIEGKISGAGVQLRIVLKN